MNRTRRFALACHGLLAAACLGYATAATAVTLADTPLFLTVDIPPNLILTLDDSGSMSRAFTPDLCGNPNAICDANPDSRLQPRYVKSAYFNPIYYDPSIRYDPPKNASGTLLTTSYTAAWLNGFDTGFGSVNLSTNYRPSAGLFISSATNKVHEFIDHSDEDLRCANQSSGNNSGNGTRYCRYPSGTGTWNIMTGNPTCTNSVSVCRDEPMPAYYYKFNAANAGCTTTVANQKTDVNCYTMVLVGSTADTTNVDWDGNGTVTAAEKQQNFANWYSFYRTRNLMTISGSARAFADVKPETRVGWQAVNSCRGGSSTFATADCDGWQNFSNVSNEVRPFTGTHKTNFYNWLFRLPTDSSTPLREALRRVGTYLTRSGTTVAALAGTPYDNFTEVYPAQYLPVSCRKNFHVLMTDGIWNDDLNTNNADNTTQTVPPTTGQPAVTYTPVAPFRGPEANTLADIAFNYWITDLAALPNSLIPRYADRAGTASEQYWNPINNPATWQHLVNFTVGLGLTPFLSAVGLTYADEGFGGSYASLKAGTTAWPLTGSGTQAQQDGARVADLWHAALNSRGKFFSADSPGDLNNAFTSIIASVSDETPSAASLAANSTQWTTNSVVYQAKFNSRDWSGNFLALPVGSTGLVGTAYWDASTLLPGYATRKVFTLNGTTRQLASCTASSPLLTALNGADSRCADRLNWIKGDSTYEVRRGGASATFRNRLGSLLGDIINSDPMYVQKEDFGYATGSFTEASTYAAYRNGNTRPPVIYVGANDGMLHAFQADVSQPNSGAELFAYIPNGVYANLINLTRPTYSHKFYVDGSPMAGDAWFGDVNNAGPSWKTVLVGGLNSGGKSIYALDVTNPTTFDATKILWEFSDSADLGFTFSQPQIGRLNSGDWVAVFGNGYNSTGDRAYLYVVRLYDGALLKKIAAGTATANGLSTPILWDQNGDKIIDYVYAGDLQGNLWKFDLSSTNSASWGVGNGGNPLFLAQNGLDRQAITAQPKVSAHPLGGALVLFGTGQYLNDTDVDSTKVQSYYGIWDTYATTTTIVRANLQAQTIDNQQTIGTTRVRVTSNNSVDYGTLSAPTKRGWYLDLVYPAAGTGGERVIATSSFLEDRVIFTTVTPSRDPCDPGGDSYLMELLALSGSRPTESVLDINGDGQFSSLDNLGGLPASGYGSTVGILKVPVIIKKPDDGKAFKILTGTSGGFQTILNKIPQSVPGLYRIYWKQIQ